jgi:glutathione S-transferase
MSTAGPVLFTFPPSLDSEFSRFVLHHYGVNAREERHVLLIQSFVTLVRAGTPRIPTLVGVAPKPLDRIERIINHLESEAPPERKLLAGLEQPFMDSDWKQFHTTLQTASTVFPYYHLVPRRDLMVRALSEGSPDWEVAAVQHAYPVWASALRVLLRLTAQRAQQARETIRSALAQIDERLSDGRRYLYGERFTLHDMAFAIAAAPAVWPEDYGGPLPSLASTPIPIQDLVAETRARSAGAFALRIYREHRGNPSPGRSIVAGRSSTLNETSRAA